MTQSTCRICPPALNISWSLDPDQQTMAEKADQSGYLPRLQAARYMHLGVAVGGD